MAYRVYIKNDYKPEIVRGKPISRHWRTGYRIMLISCLPVLAFIWYGGPGEPVTAIKDAVHHSRAFAPAKTPDPVASPEQSVQRSADNIAGGISDLFTLKPTDISAEATADWVDINIKSGDTMAQIFNRHGLSPRDLHDILNSTEAAAALKQLRPGQIISLRMDGRDLHALKFDIDLTQTLLVTKQAGSFAGEIVTTKLNSRVKQTEGIINESLFLAGQAAGLSDKLIMQLIYIYGWDIDFILDIRKGDSFKVIYEEKYKNREKVGNGPVLAAEFNNQDRKIRAVRYERDNGQIDYYTGTGTNMRKAFLRNPLNFSRISSHFNLRRKHPVLNRIRAHKGVDYAAPTGTPIKVTGDGTIQFLGKKGGYGKSIIVKHGGKYSTLYAHLSRYRKGLKRTQPVKQGQVVGYVGKTGLATGPHLHYEFRVNNRHHNPLTVKLPGAENVPPAEMDKFRIRSSYLFALLDTFDSELLAQYDSNNRL